MIDKRSFLERMVIVSLLVIMVIQILPVSLLGQELEIDPDDSTLSVETKAPEPDDDDLNVDSGAEEQQSEVPDRPEATSPQKIQKIKALPDKAILEKFELEYSEETKAENSRSEDEEPEFAAGRSIAFDTKFEISSPDPLTEEEQFTRLGIQPENFSQYELVEVPARLGKTKLELWVPADLVKDKPEVPESKADPGFELLADKPTVELVKLTGKGLSKKTDLFETEGRENELHSFWQITYPLKDLEANLDQEPREYTIRTTFKVDQDKLKDFCKLFKKLSKADADLDKRDALLDKSCLYEADKDTLGSLLLADLYDKESGKSFFDHPDEYLPALDLYILKEEIPDEESSAQESKKAVEESKAATDKTAEESKREEESEPEQVEETATSVPQGLKGLTSMVRSAGQPRSTTRFGKLELFLPPEQLARDVDGAPGNQTFNGDTKIVTFTLPITANAGDVKNMMVEVLVPAKYLPEEPIPNNNAFGKTATLKSIPKPVKVMRNGEEFWKIDYELMDFTANDTKGQGVTISVPTTFKTKDTVTPEVKIPVQATLIDQDTGKVEGTSNVLDMEFINAELKAEKKAPYGESKSVEGDEPVLDFNDSPRIRGGKTDPANPGKFSSNKSDLNIIGFRLEFVQKNSYAGSIYGYRKMEKYRLIERLPKGAVLADVADAPENKDWTYDPALDAYVATVDAINIPDGPDGRTSWDPRFPGHKMIYLQFPGFEADKTYQNNFEVEAYPDNPTTGDKVKTKSASRSFTLVKNKADQSSDALYTTSDFDRIRDMTIERRPGGTTNFYLHAKGDAPSEITDLVIQDTLQDTEGYNRGHIDGKDGLMAKFRGDLETADLSKCYEGTYSLKYITLDGQTGVLAEGLTPASHTIQLPEDVNGSPIRTIVWSADPGGKLKTAGMNSGKQELYEVRVAAIDPKVSFINPKQNGKNNAYIYSKSSFTYSANGVNYQSGPDTIEKKRLRAMRWEVLWSKKVSEDAVSGSNKTSFDRETDKYIRFKVSTSFDSKQQTRMRRGDNIEFTRVVDILPNGLEYVPNSAYVCNIDNSDLTNAQSRLDSSVVKGTFAMGRQTVKQVGNKNQLETVQKPYLNPTVIPNYHGTGHVALVWDLRTYIPYDYLNGSDPGAITTTGEYSNELFNVRYLTKIKETTPNGKVEGASYSSNIAYVDWTNTDDWKHEYPHGEDRFDINENGNKDEPVTYGSCNVTVTGSAKLVVVKEVKGHLDSGFSVDDSVANIENGGSATYAITARNGAPTIASDIVMLDLLPELGDIHLDDKSVRGSKFPFKLKSEVKPVWSNGRTNSNNFDIYYSTKNFKGMTKDAILADSSWSTTFTPEARAIKIKAKNGYALPSGEDARFEFKVSSDFNATLKKGDMSVNSAGIQAKGVPYFESNDAKARIITYGVSGRAFLDKEVNGAVNGIYDPGQDTLLGGLQVELIDENGNQVMNPQTGQPYVTTTAGDGSYTFNLLKSGRYKVRMLNPVYRGSTLTPTLLKAGDPNGNMMVLAAAGKGVVASEAKLVNSYLSNITFNAGFRLGITDLKVKKIAGTKDKPLDGASFRVVSDYKENGSPIYDQTLSTGSEFKFTELPVGKYTLTETRDIKGYLVDKTPIQFEVVDQTTNPASPKIGIQFANTNAYIEYDEVNKTLYVNNRPLAKFVLKKVDGKTNKALAGAVFEMTSSEAGFEKRTLTIPNTGELLVDMLPVGVYTLKEKTAPDTYGRLQKPIIVQVSETVASKADVKLNVQLASTSDPAASIRGPVATESHNGLLTVKNYPLAKLTVNKVDPDNKPLKDAEFKLTSKDPTTDQVIYEKSGTANQGAGNNSFDFDQVDVGTYYLIETKAPAGYQALGANEKIIIEVSRDKDGKYSFALAKEGNSDKVKDLVSVDPATGQVTVKNKKSLTLEVNKYRYDPGVGEAHYQEIPGKYAHFRIYSEKKNAQGNPLVDETWDGQTKTRIERSQNSYTLKDLEPGVYYIEEIKAPEDFLPVGDFIEGSDKTVKIELSEDAQGFSRIKVLSPMPYADFYSDVLPPEDENYAIIGKIPLLEVEENPGLKMDRLNITNMPVPKVYEKDDLFEVKKTVTGNGGDVMEPFTFTIRIDKPVYMKNHPDYQGGKWDKYKLGDQEYTYGEDHEFTLKHGESLKLSNFMFWSNVYLKEKDNKKHTTSITITEWEEDVDLSLNRIGFINENKTDLENTTETGGIQLYDHSVYPPRFGGWYRRNKYLVEFTNHKQLDTRVGFYQNNQPILTTALVISGLLLAAFVLGHSIRNRANLKADTKRIKRE